MIDATALQEFDPLEPVYAPRKGAKPRPPPGMVVLNEHGGMELLRLKTVASGAAAAALVSSAGSRVSSAAVGGAASFRRSGSSTPTFFSTPHPPPLSSTSQQHQQQPQSWMSCFGPFWDLETLTLARRPFTSAPLACKFSKSRVRGATHPNQRAFPPITDFELGVNLLEFPGPFLFLFKIPMSLFFQQARTFVCLFQLTVQLNV
eukprot:GABV01000403.1.p1 GENE.GABV01000403.1~~GABV01000403.1.p1  ORF type:complete len:212 (-),score=61.21 GABV01000403.1:743-1354(-)